jgi:hypothetical protein
VFAESPYVSNVFGGASKADMDRGGVGAQKVFNNAASATQDYSKLGIGTAGGITSLADVTKAASAAPFTLGNTMANNLGTNLGTTAGANLDLTSNAGTIGMAQGGMIMSDPVMRRAMFRNGGPVSAKGYGITSNVTTPEQNAMAMQTMFQPPGFRDGGPVQYFQRGGEAEAEAEAPVEAAAPTPLEALRAQVRNPEPRYRSVMDVVRQNREEGRMLPIDDEQAYTGRSMNMLETRAAVANRGRGIAALAAEATPSEDGPPGFFRSVVNRAGEILSGKPKAATAPRAEGADLRQANAQMRQAIDDRDANDRAGLTRVSEDKQTPPPDDTGRRIAERVPATTSLEKLKADREANKAQRRENQLLALMQAGFAMAAGRSPNALANISAGGASGVATLADLEKGRRAEDAALRREILETELAQERTREARAERQAGREQTAAQRQMSLLRDVSVNTRQEVSSINNTIAGEEAKLLAMGLTEEQKAPIKSEIQRLKNQRDAAVEQMYSVYDSMGIKRPKTPEQAGEFKFLGGKR